MKSPSPSPSTREIEIRTKVVENRTVVEQEIKISWHPHPTICLLRWWVLEWESTSMKRERLLESCIGLWKRDRDVQINRQDIQETEQMITTEEQIMSSRKERIILLLNWTILQWDCRFVEELFDFERRRINNDQSQRSTIKEKRKIARSEREKKGIGPEQDDWDLRGERFVSMSSLVLVLSWRLASVKLSVALVSVESLSLCCLW